MPHAHTSHRQLIRLIIAALLVPAIAVSFAQSAHAKGDIEATLDKPLPADAKPGTVLNVKWKLTNTFDGRTEPFSYGRIFVRLIGPGDGQVSEDVVRGDGSYSADLVVPPGGISRVEIGIKNAWITGAGKQQDHMIPISGQVLTSPPPASSDRPAALPVWIALIGGVTLVALVAGAWRLRGRRDFDADSASAPVVG